MTVNTDKMIFLAAFQDHIYKVLHGFYSDQEDDNEDIILIQAAVLLKTAMELYTISFEDDEKIDRILNSAKDSIPSLRIKAEMIGKESVTIH
tara:strand:- start:12 stop:287 length:276 start_codon:yes stop_codon:yes gene_type:complete